MQSHRILIVDGDPQARALTERLLAEEGYRTAACDSAVTAEALARRTRYACAVVDAQLQDGSGLDALEVLRRLDPGLCVIMTAAHSVTEFEAQARRAGVLYYHVKGFGGEELLQAVARAVGGKRLRRNATILVVDDDADYQAAVRQTLQGAGFEVVSALSKEEGLKALEERRPDLIILDIMMEGVTDGFHFLYAMQSQDASKRPPVLSITCVSEKTGYPFSPTTDEDYFPADDYLPKPVQPAELLEHVDALLAGHRPQAEG
jgi:DNA-binding response OmpR family regulator